MVKFTLKLHPTSEWGMNKVYAGKHWNERKEQASVIHLMVRAAIRKQVRPVQKFQKPVTVTILYNSRLDIDNHGYLAKMIIDGMKGLLIEDDNRKFVDCLVQGFHAGNPEDIYVYVE
jgi:Holliday junction resolvase RusA-like endonuclease